jgi:GNAT superfamily N-acetyltransferase
MDVSTTIHIRQARTRDIEALIELRALLLDGTAESYGSRTAEDRARWREAYRNWLFTILGNDDATAVWCAEHPYHPGLVGCATGIIDRRAPAQDCINGLSGWVQSVVVAADWRGQGIARRLMEHLMDWFTARQVAKIVLQTTPAAEQLYRAMGFVPGSESTLIRIRRTL